MTVDEEMRERESNVPASTGEGGSWAVPVIVGGIVLLAVGYVALSLQRPEPPTFPASPTDPRPADGELVGPRTYTVDASVPDRWVHFSFEEGTVVENPGPLDWDLAFRRFDMAVNGGEGFSGRGGVRDLGEVPFDSVLRAPEGGYEQVEARADSVNPALARWYDYSFLTHLLTPTERVYAVRTAQGRYAKLEFLSYYCPGARPGCITFRYVYQGAGGRELSSDP